MITRRNFIFASSGAAAGCLLSSTTKTLGQVLPAFDNKSFFDVPKAIAQDPAYYFSSQHFIPYVNSEFRVWTTDETFIELKLIEAIDKNYPKNVTRGYTENTFSLMFESATKHQLSQNACKIEHPALGTFHLLLVPVGRRRNLYEAVINRTTR